MMHSKNNNLPGPEAKILASSVESTGPLLLRYADGFDTVTAIRQLHGLPNHLLWILGHCGFTMQRVGGFLDGGEVPRADYRAQPEPEVGNNSFVISVIQRDSIPLECAEQYPSLPRGLEIFASAITRLATAVREVSPEQLASPVEWHEGPIELSQLIHRVCFHNACHAGQIVDLRRGLGLPRIIGAKVKV
jgi:hypothetical protein